MSEVWVRIEEFPTYKVSNHGRVMNMFTLRILNNSVSPSGVVKIGLVSGGAQHTRSVKVLVAEAFVEGKNEVFNTPINLDGDQNNNHADNLVWRPRWFAWSYSRQFKTLPPEHKHGPIVELPTETMYENVLSVATTNGLLIKDVWKGIQFKRPIFPTQQIFDLTK